MNTRLFIAQGAFVIGLAVAVSVADGLAGGGYDLSWNTIDGGGGKSTGGTFELEGTIGQPDAGGPLTGGTFSLTGGFWPGAAPIPNPCPADIAVPHNGVVNTDDLILLIGSWGNCPMPCPPSCPADIVQGGGQCAVNTDDLILLIGSWGNCP
jgi:hypothetical protein